MTPSATLTPEAATHPTPPAPVFRPDRLDALRARIERGEYAPPGSPEEAAALVAIQEALTAAA